MGTQKPLTSSSKVFGTGARISAKVAKIKYMYQCCREDEVTLVYEGLLMIRPPILPIRYVIQHFHYKIGSKQTLKSV